MPSGYFVGVDVGTGSTRAALVTSNGHVVKTHVEDIKTWNPEPDHYEQSSDDIWRAVCLCVKNVTENYDKEKIIGIGFDATCSLVALDKSDSPLTVSTTAKNKQNVILWMDHRAIDETDFINSTNHDLLKYVGGQVSLEMQCPKILWLKNNLALTNWRKVGKFFDLPDFLTWKCTGDDTRSLCSVVCKWNYDADENCWSAGFLETIKLTELIENNFEKIGSNVQEPGLPIGKGLTVEAAKDLGLLPHTPVGSSMIDAHAGALSLFGCTGDGIDDRLSTKMALICGTSSCHMSVTKRPIWAYGVWGPYKSAIFSDMYLHEAGQSATGILLEYIVKSHPAYEGVVKNAGNMHTHVYLNNLLAKMAEREELSNVQELTKEIHVWPDFHGNRSPLADPTLKGMIVGLTMSCEEENLAVLYLAFIQALAYGTRHILESLKKHGRSEFSSLLICGGLSKNSIFVQTHAEACALPVLFPEETEMVLVGSSILGAVASEFYPNLETASKAMGGKAHVIQPDPDTAEYHERKYKVFRKMVEDQQSYRDLMEV